MTTPHPFTEGASMIPSPRAYWRLMSRVRQILPGKDPRHHIDEIAGGLGMSPMKVRRVLGLAAPLPPAVRILAALA